MKHKVILFIIIETLITVKGISQQLRYFKNFDYAKMQGVNPLNENSLPNFYVICKYDNSGNLGSIGVVTKMDWEAYHSTRYFDVLNQNGQTLLLLGSGKQRTGYTRTLFQKKIYSSDSAMIVQDTIIYKTTSEKYIRVQFFTNINSDSIFFKEMTFPFAKNKDMKASILSSFAFYREWFKLYAGASDIVGGTIKLKSDPLLIWQKIKSSGYTNYINITKRDFRDMTDMPITFFWLKDSGLLY